MRFHVGDSLGRVHMRIDHPPQQSLYRMGLRLFAPLP